MFYSKFYLMFLIYIIKSLSRYYQLTLPLLEHKKVPISHFILASTTISLPIWQVQKGISLIFFYRQGWTPFFILPWNFSLFYELSIHVLYHFLLGSWYFSYWFLRVLYIFMILIIYHMYDKDLCVRFAFQCCGCF